MPKQREEQRQHEVEPASRLLELFLDLEPEKIPKIHVLLLLHESGNKVAARLHSDLQIPARTLELSLGSNQSLVVLSKSG